MVRQSIRICSIALGLAFLAVLYQPAFAQEDECSTPTVAVRIQQIFDYPDDIGIGSVFDELNKKVKKPKKKEEWRAEIEAAVIAELRKNSQEIKFIQNGSDCDYFFRYILIPYGVGEEFEVRPGVWSSEFVGFLMLSCLGTEKSCIGYRPRLVLCICQGENRDIFQAIISNVGYYGNLKMRIARYEKRFPVPPRGPKINRSLDRDYVSPLEGETELNIKVQVTNCKGDPVFDRYHREQKVLYQRKTKRGELTADEDFNYYDLVDKHNSDANYLVLGIYQPKGVSARYTLQKGIEASLDSVEIKTCGRKKDAIDTAEVKIMGLDLKVSARKKELLPMQSTQIDISFNKIGQEGGKIPIAGKTVQIKVSGLVNGTVYPQGDVETNSRGQATLTYTAGDQDEEVTFRAKFQPKKFKEFVQDKAKVKVIKFDRLCQITRKSSHTTDYTENLYNEVRTHKWTEISEITISVTFNDNPRVDIAFDPVTMQSKPRRYVYYVDDYWISSSYHTGSGSREETVGSGEHIQRHISSSNNQNGTFQDLQPSNDDARMTVTVDPATGKATEIGLPSFGAVISIMNQSDCDGEKRVEGRLEPFDCSSTNQYTQDFPIQSFREKCMEISGGDGVQIIRGQCRENKNTSQGSKEESFEWVIYIKK
ncbi:MAG: hypothetical protein GY841_01315 [FCB group bacterium]|nr:hypothetical protein [FCB group bacterium]